MGTLGFAFLAGFLSLMSPCVWPLIPVLMTRYSLGQGRRLPLRMTLGVLLSFPAMFTLIGFAIAGIQAFLPFEPKILRMLAILLLGISGVTLAFPSVSRRVQVLLSSFMRRNIAQPALKNEGRDPGFLNGVALGVTLAGVWTPCIGVVLGGIIALASYGASPVKTIVLFLVYGTGVIMPLILLGWGSKWIVTRIDWIARHQQRFEQIIGVGLLLLALSLVWGLDHELQRWVAPLLPPPPL